MENWMKNSEARFLLLENNFKMLKSQVGGKTVETERDSYDDLDSFKG